MKRILVTGGSGRVGHYVIEHLLAQDYAVVNLDVKPPEGEWLCPFQACDMSDYGQTFACLYGFDAVVHLAADPRPDSDHFSGAQRFHNNTLATYNVFNAAVALGLERVVWASSETVYGYPFDAVIPDYAPLDEQHPYSPQSSYALSKLVSETMAAQFSRLSGIPFVGLQLSNVIFPAVYAQFPNFWRDPKLRIFDLWSYVDCRDTALAVELSLSAHISGADVFIIAANDTVMNRPSAELMAEYFPTTRLPENLGTFQSLMSSAKAQRILGYNPRHSWRSYLPPNSGA